MIEDIDSLIFDLDGTLWDSSGACAIAINHQIEEKQLKAPAVKKHHVSSAMGLPHNEYILKVFEHASPQEKLELAKHAFDHTHIGDEGSLVYDGVKQGIVRLSQHFPLYIVSNCESGYIENFLKLTDMQKYFKDIECWGNTLQPKDQNILKVIQRNNLKNPIYIGDTQGDKTAAEKAGIPFIAVNYGFGDVQSIYTVKNFSEIVDLVLK